MFDQLIADSYFLHKRLEAAGVPVQGCAAGPKRVDYDPAATPEQITTGANVAAGFDTVELVASNTTISRLVDGNETGPVYVATVTAASLGNDWGFTVHDPDGQAADGTVDDGVLEFSATVPGTYVIEAFALPGYAHGYLPIEVI